MKSKCHHFFAKYKYLLALTTSFIFFMSSWLTVWVTLPNKWLGLMDGYYFQEYEKNFSISYIWRDADFSHLPVYPPYWFWLWGRIYSFFHVIPLTKLYWLTWGIGILLSCLFCYFILREVIGKFSAIFYVPVYLCFNLIQFRSKNIGNFSELVWQKPQEVLAYSVCAALLVRAIVKSESETLRVQLWFGVLMGFLIGDYYPAAIPMFVGIILVGIYHEGKSYLKNSLLFVLISLVVSFPELITLLKLLFTFHNLGSYLIWVPDEFQLLNWISPFFIGIVTLSYFFTKKYIITGRKIIHIVVFILVFGFLLQLIVNQFGIEISLRPDILLSLTTPLLLINLIREIDVLINNEYLKIISGMVFLCGSLFVLAPLSSNLDVKVNTDLSTSRVTDKPLVLLASQYDSKYCGSLVLANGEFQFLQTLTKCDTPMYLPFSEGYVSESIPYMERIQALSQLQSNVPTRIANFVKNENIKVIALFKSDSLGSAFSLMTRINGKPGDSLTPLIVIDNQIVKAALLSNGWRVIQDSSQVLVMAST